MKRSTLPATVRPSVVLNADGKPMGYIGQPAHHAADVQSQELMNFRPPLYSADAAWLPERNRVVPRVLDLARNDGWTSGTLNRYVDEGIGASFRMTYMPDHVALGIDHDDACDFALQVEAAWRQYANDARRFCDANERATFSGMAGLAFRHKMRDGECFAAVEWRAQRPWFKWRTALRVISPEQVSNPHDAADTNLCRGGVEMTEAGVPTGYWVRAAHPGHSHISNTNDYRWVKVDRRTPWGRPVMIHHFEAEEAGQTRGKSNLVTIVKRLFMAGRYADAEMQAALINATLAAYIESSMSEDDVSDALAGGSDFDRFQSARADFHEKSKVTLNGARIPVLYPGEKINAVEAERPSTSFPAFEKRALRYIAAATGQSYEAVGADYSETNYSSARAGMLGPWKHLTARRDAFGQNFCTPFFSAWIEEAIDNGTVKLPKGAPDFWDAYAAYTTCSWAGPGRGWVDPVKEAEAAQLRIDAGLSCLQFEAGDQGNDYYDLMVRQARERKLRKEFGLPEVTVGALREHDEEEESRRKERRRSDPDENARARPARSRIPAVPLGRK